MWLYKIFNVLFYLTIKILLLIKYVQILWNFILFYLKIKILNNIVYTAIKVFLKYIY